MTPAVEEVAEKFSEKATVVKVNVDENPAISSRYNVRGIPTLILFKDGKETDRLIGLHTKEQIAALVDGGKN